MTGVSVVTNEKGQPTAVLVPLKKWDEVPHDLEKLKILQDLKSGFREIEAAYQRQIKNANNCTTISSIVTIYR